MIFAHCQLCVLAVFSQIGWSTATEEPSLLSISAYQTNIYFNYYRTK